jgi:hypothetical protein
MTRVNPFDNVDYWVISEVPIGWTNSQRHNAQKAMRNGVGIQSNVQPHLRTEFRPMTPTLFDEDGNVIDDPPPTATSCILTCKKDTVERHDIIQSLSDTLGVPYEAVDAKVETEKQNQDEARVTVANPEWGG